MAQASTSAAPGQRPPPAVRRVIVLGATGSIGRQALDVVEHLGRLHSRGECPVRPQVVGLAAGTDAAALAEAARRCGARELALARGQPPEGGDLRWRAGEDAAERLVREVEADLVLGAIVGIAGLRPTLAAIELGRDVALANKETLVAAGALVVPAARRSGARLLPVDSEHSGLWQALQAVAPGAAPPMDTPADVQRVVLTASGGPFRGWDPERMYRATPDEALRHPTWAMGPKVTVDCASLMNKALEVIEAHWLFGAPAAGIDALIHPQSVVHALVEMIDGSVIAQLGPTDMRLPIQNALAYPHRVSGVARPLDWRELGKLEFEPADRGRYPALRLAYEAIEAGGTAGAVLNAANEEAVAAFLRRDGVPFGRIAELAAEALSAIGPAPITHLGDVFEADAEARRFVRRRLGIV